MKSRTRRALLVALVSLVGLTVPFAAADDPIDRATTVRVTNLLSEPSHRSTPVKQLAEGAELAVYERQRLWVRVAADDEPDTQGWLRFTELRFSRAAPQSTTQPASAGGFSGFSRSVSGFLNSFRGRGSRTANTTSTIGIRGLTVAELESAAPNPAALQWLNTYTTTPEQAQQFAAAGGLSAKTVGER